MNQEKVGKFISQCRENGVAARAAIGMGTLPGVAPVEVQLICGVIHNK